MQRGLKGQGAGGSWEGGKELPAHQLGVCESAVSFPVESGRIPGRNWFRYVFNPVEANLLKAFLSKTILCLETLLDAVDSLEPSVMLVKYLPEISWVFKHSSPYLRSCFVWSYFYCFIAILHPVLLWFCDCIMCICYISKLNGCIVWNAPIQYSARSARLSVR